MRGLVGKKIGMSRIFDDSGAVVPVTVLQLGPCTVVQIKTINKDGYNAVQVGYDSAINKKTNKPKFGHFNKHNVKGPYKKLLEFPTVPDFKYKSGQMFNVAIFQLGDLVNVSGITKGTSGFNRKALELSIIKAPAFLMVSNQAFEIELPAEASTKSILSKELLLTSSTSNISPLNINLLPMER